MKKLYKVRQRTQCWRDVYVEAEDGRIASKLVDECGPIEALTPWSPASGDRSTVEQAETGEVVMSGKPSEYAQRLWPIPPAPERVAARAKAARHAPTEAPRRVEDWPAGSVIRYAGEDGTPKAAYVERPGLHGALWVRGPRGAWRRRGALTSGRATEWAALQGYATVGDVAGLPPLPTSVDEMTDDDWRAIAPRG